MLRGFYNLRIVRIHTSTAFPLQKFQACEKKYPEHRKYWHNTFLPSFRMLTDNRKLWVKKAFLLKRQQSLKVVCKQKV